MKPLVYEQREITERRDDVGALEQSYTTDAKGRITQITTGGVPFTYAYDPFDYRINKMGSGVAASYLLAGEHVETVTGSHQAAQFFRGIVVDEIVNGYQFNPNGVWTNYTYAHDALQSVVGLTGHEGRTIQTTAYSPFGNEIAEGSAGASCSVLRYTGREQDAENGLYYYRARYYDPELGRFLTEDPLGFAAGMNFYAYVNNNPINANDPSGKLAFFWHYLTVLGAGIAEGRGIESFSFATDAMMTDFRDNQGLGSFDLFASLDPSPAVQNFHALSGSVGDFTQSPEAARIATVNNINRDLNSGNSRQFGRALHNVVDAGSHHLGEQVPTGILDTTKHLVKDVFDFSGVRQGFNNARELFQAQDNQNSIQLGQNGAIQQVSKQGFEGSTGLYANTPNSNVTRSVYCKTC